MPDEEEQFAAYSQVVRAMAGRPVGHPDPWMWGETNRPPVWGLRGTVPLGMRGIRLSLAPSPTCFAHSSGLFSGLVLWDQFP